MGRGGRNAVALFLFVLVVPSIYHAARYKADEPKAIVARKTLAFMCLPESDSVCVAGDQIALKDFNKRLTKIVTAHSSGGNPEQTVSVLAKLPRRDGGSGNATVLVRRLLLADEEALKQTIARSINAESVGEAERERLCKDKYGVNARTPAAQEYLNAFAFGAFVCERKRDSCVLVATAGVKKQGESAYIGMVYTARECQGRSFATLLLGTVIRVASEEYSGRAIELRATNTAKGMYTKLGFVTAIQSINALNNGTTDMIMHVPHTGKGMYTNLGFETASQSVNALAKEAEPKIDEQQPSEEVAEEKQAAAEEEEAEEEAADEEEADDEVGEEDAESEEEEAEVAAVDEKVGDAEEEAE